MLLCISYSSSADEIGPFKNVPNIMMPKDGTITCYAKTYRSGCWLEKSNILKLTPGSIRFSTTQINDDF